MYWDHTAAVYQSATRISCDDFHYGPLLPGDRQLQLLPASVSGLNCLEVGAGAAQNSIVLARKGAQCTALDISGQQLAHGRQLCRQYGVDIDFVQGDMSALPLRLDACFDLIHSVYALAFAGDQGAAITEMARCLRPGGQLVLVTAHPLFSGEWLEVDDQDQGMFILDYFQPPADRRLLPGEITGSCCQPQPLSAVAEWLTGCGLVIERLLEPRPPQLEGLTEAEIQASIPYDSADWRTLGGEMRRIPAVALFVARRPANKMET